MSLRFLLGVLAPGVPSKSNQSLDEEIENEEAKSFDIIVDFQTPAKFHIGMLTISLITGLAFGAFITYNCWMEKNVFLGYIRNLVIALTCRTFFSIIFDGAILLGTPLNVGGGNALLAFEQISLNLVLAFWLTLNIYIHARAQRNFNSEPTLRLYQYGVPGVAVFFAFIWIFTLQDQIPSFVWWMTINPFTQWIVNSINLLFILIQLMLVIDTGRMMMKTSLDNDSLSLLKKTVVMMSVLVLIFWLQFGFTIGRVPLKNNSSYLYFFYFIDGLECAFVCLTLYFFNKWVLMLLDKVSNLMTGLEEPPPRAPKSKEALLNGSEGRRIVTIDSILMASESENWKNVEKEGIKDVVYSNVIGPERLKKTLELYKRLNIVQSNPITVVDGEKFYDCPLQNTVEDSEKVKLHPQLITLISDTSKQKTICDNAKFKSDKVCGQIQKKNAFYSSKYLIVEPKSGEFPKYLETRPSVSSKSGHESLKEEQINENLPFTLNSLMSDELVQKWLNENSENMQKKKEKINPIQKASTAVTAGSKMSKRSALETSAGSSTENDSPSALPGIVSTINSVVSRALFRSSNKGNNTNIEKGSAENETNKKNSISSSNLEQLSEKKKALNNIVNEKGTLNSTTSSKNTNEIQMDENENQNQEKLVKFEATEVLNPTPDTEGSPPSPRTSVKEKKSSEPMATTDEIKDSTTNAEISDRKVSLGKSLNECLSDSKLLELSLQQAEINADQLPDAINNSFSWSETISSTIGSLINAGGIFFSGSKNDTSINETSEIESKYSAVDNLKIPQEGGSVLQSYVEFEAKNFENATTTRSESEKEHAQTEANGKKVAIESALCKKSDSNLQTETLQESVLALPDTDERSSHCTENMTPKLLEQEEDTTETELYENDSTELLKLTSKIKQLTSDQTQDTFVEKDDELFGQEFDSENNGVQTQSIKENEIKNLISERQSNDVQSDKTVEGKPVLSEYKIAEEEIHKPPKQPIQNNQITDQTLQTEFNEQNEILVSEFQNNRYDITKNELILKNKSENCSFKHHQTHKANKQKLLKKSKEVFATENKSDLPFPVIQESIQAKNASDLASEKQTVTCESSDSEFRNN